MFVGFFLVFPTYRGVRKTGGMIYKCLSVFSEIHHEISEASRRNPIMYLTFSGRNHEIMKVSRRDILMI